MTNQSIWAAAIIGAALVVSAVIVSAGLKKFGKDMEQSATVLANHQPVIPTSLQVQLGDLKIANATCGGGDTFRIQTTGK